MSAVKQDLADRVNSRRDELFPPLQTQWKACKRTRPRGHIYDGTVGRNHFYKVCLYCGKPDKYDLKSDIKFLEKCAAEMHLYPIARQEEKGLAFT